MSIELILQKNLIADENIHQVTRNDVKYESGKSEQPTRTDIAISLTPLALVISCMAFFLLLRKHQTSTDHKKSFIINSLTKVPCKNCQYYANNHYLKCAVKPDIVMTEEAKNCSEYSPDKNKSVKKNLFGRNDNS
ncbi:hypothetical protein NIES2100_69060 [Calothrix sp. NIES-2100]|uniref:hypothetical protein n=1 Tax=Calothrix sp. NIES-2100 TaxID=1954172 RepID=UPI000B5FF429|nr:hypothetical protein NIES2100_69060 [Calothrix sp. NIES-2100]